MKKLWVVLAMCMCFTLVGCGEEYEDTNGPQDYTLQTLTDENIIKRDVGASGLAYEESDIAGLKSSEYSAKNFNGVEEIYITNFIFESDIEFYIGHLNIKSGNLRIVAINDDEIIYDFPLDAFNETVRFENLKGTFSVRIAGESAAFDMHIDVL